MSISSLKFFLGVELWLQFHLTLSDDMMQDDTTLSLIERQFLSRVTGTYVFVHRLCIRFRLEISRNGLSRKPLHNPQACYMIRIHVNRREIWTRYHRVIILWLLSVCYPCRFELQRQLVFWTDEIWQSGDSCSVLWDCLLWLLYPIFLVKVLKHSQTCKRGRN